MDIISQLFPLPPIPTVQQAVFIGIALLTVIGALIVAIAPDLYHNALGLIVAFFGAAGIFALIGSRILGDQPNPDLCRRHLHLDHLRYYAHAA